MTHHQFNLEPSSKRLLQIGRVVHSTLNEQLMKNSSISILKNQVPSKTGMSSSQDFRARTRLPGGRSPAKPLFRVEQSPDSFHEDLHLPFCRNQVFNTHANTAMTNTDTIMQNILCI